MPTAVACAELWDPEPSHGWMFLLTMRRQAGDLLVVADGHRRHERIVLVVFSIGSESIPRTGRWTNYCSRLHLLPRLEPVPRGSPPVEMVRPLDLGEFTPAESPSVIPG